MSNWQQQGGGHSRPPDPAMMNMFNPGGMAPVDPIILEGMAVWGRTPQTQNVSPQITLYKQGGRADTAFLLLRGRVNLVRENAVRRSSLTSIQPGQWLAVAELIHGRPYAATAIAQEPSVVIPVPLEMLQRLFQTSPQLTFRALSGATSLNLSLVENLEAQALDQTFMGLCRGLEMLLPGGTILPESQLYVRLRELFSLPIPSIKEALKVLESLNLLKRTGEVGKEQSVSLADPATFSERVRAFADQWKGRLPSLVASEPPREAMRIEELCEALNVKPQQLLRRMTLPDFPLGIMRFDPEGVELIRKTQGDTFFKKKVTGRELLSQIESVEELIDVDVDLLKEIVPKMEIPKLIRLVGGVDGKLRDHLLNALSSRTKRTVMEELQHVGAVSSRELGDLEAEILRYCRSYGQ